MLIYKSLIMSNEKIKERDALLKEVLELIEKNGITAYEIEQNTTLSAVGVQKIINGETKRPLTRTLEDITSYIRNKYNPEEEEASTSNKNFIPFYEDVATFGGSDNVASMESIYNTSIQIDAGDWFRGATAAVRHYGDSMIEYPSGCILAIRELKNKNEIVWGRNYVIETSERRITKQIAELDKDNIICYSTNTEKHMDGRLKHQPIIILKEDIRFISRVLGSVNKEESTGKVQLL